MSEEKKSTYKGFTEARAKANKIKIRMLPEERDVLKAHIERTGESANAFLHRAITETMERDKTKQE